MFFMRFAIDAVFCDARPRRDRRRARAASLADRRAARREGRDRARRRGRRRGSSPGDHLVARYDRRVSTQPLRQLLESAFPDATELDVIDRTGGGDHFQVVVTAPSLDGPVARRAAPPGLRGAVVRRSPTAPSMSYASRRRERRELHATRSRKCIDDSDVAIFMKGTPAFAMCGNSDRALQALRRAGASVTAVDVLPDPQIRQDLTAISGWPTIPQVFVKGELVGGADIVEELEASGELEQTLRAKLGDDYSAERARRPSRSSRRSALQRREHVVGVRRRLHLVQDLLDVAVLADHEGRAVDAHVRLAHVRLLDPDAVGIGDLVLRRRRAA